MMLQSAINAFVMRRSGVRLPLLALFLSGFGHLIAGWSTLGVGNGIGNGVVYRCENSTESRTTTAGECQADRR